MTEKDFARVKAEFEPKIRLYLRARLPEQAEAERAAAEVLRRMEQAAPRVDAKRLSLSAWAYTLCRLVVQSQEGDGLAQARERQRARAAAAETFSRLKERERDLLVLRLVKGWSIQEIAWAFQAPPAAVRQSLRRCLEKWKGANGEQGDGG